MKRFIFLLAVLSLLFSGCAATQPAATPLVTTGQTLTPTSSPSLAATPTPLTPTPTPTPRLIVGTLTIKVNVRSGPGTNYDSLGQLNAGEKVQIMVRDDTGKWYRIHYPATPDGYAWVTAQYVQVPTGTLVPVEASPTPAGPTGRVLQRLNVRSGPGLTFDTLGLLEPDALVVLTGKNSTASWFQIDYPDGPSGYGWVTAQYIQTDTSNLPVLDDYGTPVANSMPTFIPTTPTPTIGPAYNDADSRANPAIQVIFSASGTRQFTYSSQVSTPMGDPEDWIEFTPYSVNTTEARLVFSLTCSGNGRLIIELEMAGTLLSGWGTLSCGDIDKLILLPSARAYEMHIRPVVDKGLQLVDYVLSVQNKP